MSQITETPFGKGKTFIEVERCKNVLAQEREKLTELSDSIAVETLLMVDPPRPKAIISDTDMTIVLRGINLNEDANKEDMVSVRIWLNEQKIIVSQNNPVKSVDVVQTRLARHSRPVDVLIDLTDELFDRIEGHIFEMEERVDESEEHALENPDQKQRHTILSFRREIIALRRYLLPQRETMMMLSRGSSKLLTPQQREVMTNQYFRAARICDHLDALRERLSLIQEEITAIISDRMNKNMYVLAIISLVFLPLGFITGLFGINVGGMPWTETTAGFWIVCTACAIAAIFIMALMRWRKWI